MLITEEPVLHSPEVSLETAAGGGAAAWVRFGAGGAPSASIDAEGATKGEFKRLSGRCEPHEKGSVHFF